LDTTGACENAKGAANGGRGAEVVAPGAMGRASSGYGSPAHGAYSRKGCTNWRVTGPANGHRTASPPVGIPSSMQAPMQSRPS